MKPIVLILLAMVGAPLCAAETGRPNVLLIMADDLNNALGCYGYPRVQSPNLDKLAARGVRFDRAYCTIPLCGPSRNSMLTGLYPNTTGIFVNGQIFRQTIPNQISLPQAFRQQGYFAARIGKLYHFHVPLSVGTNGHDDPASWEMSLNPAGVDRTEEESKIFSITPGSFGASLSWYASPHSDAQHTDGKQARDAEWVLERCAQQSDEPFFLAVGFFRPHLPFVAPQPYFDLYAESDMPVVRGVKEDQTDIPAAALASYRKEQDKLTDDLRRQARQAYYASISFMDAQVGRVVAALDRLGLADNTIIVFTSDHGYLLGEHGLWQKQSLFEESARVPLIIVAPGDGPRGVVVTAAVSHVDLYPTLMQLAGIDGLKNLQGQSLVPMLKDPLMTGRGWAITQTVRSADPQRNIANPALTDDDQRYFGYSITDARWRYTEWNEGRQGRELYDHKTDPSELINLADAATHADVVGDLSQQLQAAVLTTFPPSGQIPAVSKDGLLWAPQYLE